MTLRTYQAPTMAEALSKVKKDLGKDAVILRTREFRKGAVLGLFGKPTVEITASIGVNVARPRGMAASPAQSDTLAPGPALQRAYGLTAKVASPLREVSGAAPLPAMVADARAAVATANVSAAVSGIQPEIREELAAIRTLLGQVLQDNAKAAARAPEHAQIAAAMPRELLTVYLKLIQQDVGRQIADKLAADLRDELTPAELADAEVVRQSTLRKLESLIPADSGLSPPVRQSDGRPQTMAFIGPTGVGKTTTIAKLAATYRLRHGRKVGLITADTYRIAAVDQLRTYANIIGVPLRVALTPEEMATACASMGEMDAILIDTAGRSPTDDDRLNELAGTLVAARPHQTHLVLAGVAGEAALLQTLDRFGPMNPSRVIFTKLDEAASFGVMLNVLGTLSATAPGLRISYVTTGQEVPDDIEPGRPDRLARMVLDGVTERSGHGERRT
ncbi:MAG: flagellar biosynthesis protein FlhF [Phycisphaerales bacterium]